MFRNKLKGFTMVEMLTTLAVTAVVMTGVVATFSNVTRSADNATKGAALTNTARGLADLLETDFASAGRGYADLISLDVRFHFDSDFFVFPTGDEVDLNMYAISDLDYDDGEKTSEITLQWFDYDVRENPSFFFHTDDATWGDGTTTYQNGILYTNDTDSLSDIVAGDILLIYNLTPLVDRPSNTDTVWNRADNYNQALILQVGTAGSLETDDENRPYRGMAGKVELTFQDGPIFSNELGNPVEGPYDDTASTSFPEHLISDTNIRDTGYAMKGGFWMARKLGNADSFNRVSYRVVQGSTAGSPSVLARIHNGEYEIVATDVEKFIVSLGLDVSPGTFTTNDTMDPDLMDGRVSILDASAWTKEKDSTWSGVSDADFKIAIGRHSLQARVEFAQWGAQDKNETKEVDDGEGGTTDEAYHKTRGFVQQYRLRNISAPLSTD